MNKKYLRNNNGFSILELMIVVAIVMIMIAFIGITIGTSNSANINKAAKSLQSALVKGRVESMAKGQDAGVVSVWMDNDCCYVKVGDGASEQIVNHKANVYAAIFDVSTSTATGRVLFSSTASAPFKFYFNNMGGMDKALTSGGGVFNAICFERGSRQTYVVISKETGKIQVVTK